MSDSLSRLPVSSSGLSLVPASPRRGRWPRPPACLPHARLDEPPGGARVAVAGLVLVRQRPGTAKGVVFVTLEDETGVANVVVWKKVFERFRRAVIAGRLLRVTGRLQRQGAVTHVVAEEIEDISDMLDLLAAPPRPGLAAPDEAASPAPVHGRAAGSTEKISVS